MRKIFSIIALSSLFFQNLFPIAIFAMTVSAEDREIKPPVAVIESKAVSLGYDSKSNNFSLNVVSDVDREFLLTYSDLNQDSSSEATLGATKAIQGLAKSEKGEAKAEFFGGICSDGDCVADFIKDGELVLPGTDYQGTFEVSENQTWLRNEKLATTTDLEVKKEYVAPQNDQVKLTFTKLPENPGKLFIEEVELSDVQMKALGAYSKIAYDISSDMENGSFEYDLELPMPEGIDQKEAKVVYAESVEELSVEKVEMVAENKVDLTGNEVKIDGLDHFTVFVVTSFEEAQSTAITDGYNNIWFAWGASGAQVERVPSGTNGIISSEGNFHAEINDGAFTRWDGYKTEFPIGGYDTSVDVYLDMALADGSSDLRFDFSSAISNVTNVHRRDFIIHLGTNPNVAGQWLASASNNSPGWPGNPALNPVNISESGWYTIEHSFRENISGVLEVTISIYKKGESVPVGAWLRSDPSDIIGTTVGGNRYGWFIWNSASPSWIAIDNATIEYQTPTISTVIIPKDNLSWLFNRDLSTSSPFEFNTNQASIGTGSLYAKPIANTYPIATKEGNDKFIAEDFILTPIADINKISYDFMIGTGGDSSDANHFYMSVYANFGGSSRDKYYDCRYSVVPNSGSTSGFTTVTFDPSLSYPVATRTGAEASPHACPAVPADMDNLSPGSTIRVYALNMGDTSMNDTGLDGYFDNVVVDKGLDITVYDFEPMNLSTPTNLGWNLRSESATAGERPVDIECSKTTNGDFPIYSNGMLAHNWETSDSISNLKFQRQWMSPGSGSWTTDGTVYSVTNTNFATLGSDAGTEGTWNTRVRSWLDQNGNNTFDEGIDLVSGWSDECQVTYDRDYNSDTNHPVMSDIKMFVNGVESWLTKPGDTVKIQAHVSDVSGVDKIQIWVREYPWSPNNNQLSSGLLTNAGGDIWEYVYVVPSTYEDGDSLNQGAEGNYFNFRPYDTLGNSHIGWRHNFTIDSTSPEAPTWITSPFITRIVDVNRAGDNQGGNIKFSASSSTDVARYQYQYVRTHLNGTYSGSSTNVSISPSICTAGICNWNNVTIEKNQMWVYRLRAVDHAGNTSEWTNWNGLNDSQFMNLRHQSISYQDFINRTGAYSSGNGFDASKNNGFTIREEVLPISSITAPDSSGGLVFTNSSVLNILYNASDAHTAVGNVKLFSSVDGGSTFSEVASSTTGSFNYSLPDEGDYCFYTQAEDIANMGILDLGIGNQELAKSCQLNVISDQTAPDVEITTPSAGSVNGIVEIKGTVTDDNPHHYWFVVQNSGGTTVAGPGVVNDTNSFTNTSLLNWDTKLVPDGIYTIKLEARDSANNKDSGSVHWIEVTVDNTVNIPLITSPTTGDSFNSSPIRAEWNAVTDASGIQKYEIKYDYLINGVPTTAYREVAGNRLYRNQSLSGAIQGEFTIAVRAYDNLGNVSDWSAPATYIYDSIAPSSTITTFDTEESGEEVRTPVFDGLIQGTATDPTPSSGLSRVELEITYDSFAEGSTTQYWDGSEWQDSAPATRITATGTNPWSYQIPSEEVSEGIYNVTSHAVDNAGNIETTYTIRIVYDKTIPEVDLAINPTNPDGDNGWYRTLPQITLTASDNYQMDRIEYQWNSTSATGWTTYVGPISPPAEGQSILYYRGIDVVGNTGTRTTEYGVKEVKFDQTAPLNNPLNVRVRDVGSKTATGKWDKPTNSDDITRYVLSWRHEKSGDSKGKTVGSDVFETELNELYDGDWVFTVRAMDDAGNYKLGTAKFTVGGSSGSSSSSSSTTDQVLGATTEEGNPLTNQVFAGVVAGLNTQEAEAEDEENESEIDAMTLDSEEGMVLGDSVELCTGWKYFLPVILLALQALAIIGYELLNRSKNANKLLVVFATTAISIGLFFLLRDKDCSMGGSVMSLLTTWFVPVALTVSAIIKTIFYAFIEEV